MRKIFIFALFFLFFFLGSSYFSDKTNAAGCQLTAVPQAISANYNQDLTITSQGECFTSPSYRIVIYSSQFNNVKTAFNKQEFISGLYGPQPLVASQNNVGPTSKSKLVVNLASTTLSNLIAFLGKDSFGPWNVSVCLQAGNISECEEPSYFVGQTTITVNPLAPTPTPTPQDDQLIIDTSPQSTCTYAIGKDEDVKISIIKNINYNEGYNWWWKGFSSKWNYEFQTLPGEKSYLWGSAYTTPPETLDQPPDVPVTVLTISGSQISSDLGKDIVKQEGQQLCVDIKGKVREGANCIRLYFKPAPPETLGINPACSSANSGAVTPTPTSPLPQCAQWANLLGTPIPFDQAKNEKDAKCIAVDTAIGQISIEPAKFVQFIFSVVLGLAGGIALLLIIISGYQFMAAQGNPEATKGATERLVSAIVGLLFIIFAFVILQIIGVDILRIPGFNP